MKATLAKGDTTSLQVDESMMALKWFYKRPVCMLSTIHDDSMTTEVRHTHRVEGGQEEIRKPVVVEEYNAELISLTSCSLTIGSLIVWRNGGSEQHFTSWIWLW